MFETLVLVIFLLAVGIISPGWRQAYPALLARAASSDKQNLLQEKLESHFPDISRFCKVELRPSWFGWIATVSSRISAIPWQYNVYVWGNRPNLDKVAKMLAEPILWFTPQAKAYKLAVSILGQANVARVMGGVYFEQSRINPRVEYRFTPYSSIIYCSGRPLGSFCLNAQGRYPLWDVVLSRILMVQGSELTFLRTANFICSGPPLFAVPMTREQFRDIYGEEALEQWDTYTSSTPAKVTQR